MLTGMTPITAERRLRSRGFVQLWSGTAAANLADGITLTAAPLAAATLTRDPVLVSGLVVAQRLPWFLFSLVSGALVDRLDRRTLLVVANAVRALALGGLTAALTAGVEHIALLYASVFALGTAETVVDNAALAVLPSLVDRADLGRANGRIYATQSVLNELVGPPVGSWLFALAAAVAFGTGAAAFAVAAAVLAAVPLRGRGEGPEPQPLGGAIRQGFSWFWRSRLIRTVAAMAGVVNLFGAATLGVLVLVAQERLGLDSVGYGLLLSGAALGGVAGGLVAERLTRRLGSGVALFLSNLLPGLGYLGLAVTTDAVVAGILLALGSFAAMVGNVVVITLRQAAVPDHLLGRVTSAYRLIALGALPLGGLLGGALARGFGLTAPFLAGAFALTVLAFALAPVLTTRAMDGAIDAPPSADTAGSRTPDR